MVKIRYKNGYETEATEEIARRLVNKGKVRILEDVKPEEKKEEDGKPETKAEIYELLKSKGIELKNIQSYKLDELKEMAGIA